VRHAWLRRFLDGHASFAWAFSSLEKALLENGFMAQILVMENDLYRFQQIKKCLADNGHIAWRAASPQDGLLFLDQYCIDAVLYFSGLNETEVSNFLSEIAERKGKPVSALSYGEEFDAKLFWEQVQQIMPATARKNDSLGGEVKTYSLHEVNWDR
jgi:hypothetical protein